MIDSSKMLPPEKTVSRYIRDVYYYETDRMGIVHHSNYIRWLEEARNHFYEEAGFSYASIEQAGIMIPVVSAGCRYKTPFRYGEHYEIEVLPSFFNGVKFSFEYRIYDAQTKELRAEGSSEHCFSDYDLKPIRLNRQNPEIFSAFQPYFPTKAKQQFCKLKIDFFALPKQRIVPE